MTNPNRWNPRIIYSRNDSTDAIRWSFSTYAGNAKPLSFVKCEMEGFGTNTSGFGDGFFIKNAMVSAFAEAWERHWLLKVAASPSKFSILPSSSNGFAAGETNEAAVRRSREELIERAILVSAWQAMAGWTSYAPTSLVFRFFRILLDRQGWTTETYRLHEEKMGSVLAMVARHPTFGTCFDTKYVTDGNFQKAESRLIHSLLRATAVRSLKASATSGQELPEQGKPEDHEKFYRDPKNTDAFSFLNSPQSSSRLPPLPDHENIQTHLLHEVGNFPAVAVSVNPSWKPFTWGRQSIEGRNPWPHPLA